MYPMDGKVNSSGIMFVQDVNGVQTNFQSGILKITW